jgi:uncharacterized membrane protein YfhO
VTFFSVCTLASEGMMSRSSSYRGSFKSYLLQIFSSESAPVRLWRALVLEFGGNMLQISEETALTILTFFNLVTAKEVKEV